MLFQLHGVRQRVHREAVLRGSLRAEEVDLGAEAENEVVVAERFEVGELHLARRQVDALHGRLVDGDVVVTVKEIAKRVPHGARLEQARRELVEQRLEGVVVVLVDEHDVGVRLLELLRGADPGKAAAEDEHAWPGLLS